MYLIFIRSQALRLDLNPETTAGLLRKSETAETIVRNLFSPFACI